MEITNFMVGDWITIVPKHNEKIKYNSTIRDGKELDELLSGYHAIEPIPITKEILEKNGFKVKKYYYELVLDEEKVRIQSDCHLLFIDSLWINMGGSTIMNIHCEYVHELQHALQMIGSKYKIKL